MAQNNVSIHELTKRFGSKRELFDMLSMQGNLFLPSYRFCTYDFLLQICDQKKKTFDQKEIARVNLRTFREIRMRAVLKQVLPHSVIESYLPDKKREIYKVDEWFVLSIVAKLEPEWFNAVVKATFECRFTRKDEEEKQFTLNMPANLKKVLMETPFQPKKIGKARRFLKLAAAGHQVVKRETKKFQIPSLHKYKRAKSAGKLDELSMVMPVGADINVLMSEESDPE